MKQVLLRRGRAVVEEVPAPVAEPGTVLIRVDHSCISAGTELSGLKASGTPLWQRAIRQPQKVKKLVETVASQGIASTRSLVESRIGAGEATGYSAAGVVVEVGSGVTDLHSGDRVACAGSQAAHHAELVRVPRNLVVPIPVGVGFPEASTVTLGAIALQGVRRASPTLGETFVVIGLGIIGQLTVQLLRANGCRVVGTDVDPDRVRIAAGLGMEFGLTAEQGDNAAQVSRLTDGVGADGAIVTAASPSDAVIAGAFRMCRKKGRVVLVGDVGLDLNRADFYEKELDFLISSSYGPGRYDTTYEELGLDYPVGYVRWTENRNMSEYLSLVGDGRVRLNGLIGSTFPIGQATEAFDALQSDAPARPLTALLSYPRSETAPVRRIPNPRAATRRSGALRVGLIGAGGFAKVTHLPNMQALPDSFQLHAVASRTGLNASATAKQFGAKYATTDVEEILSDADVDLVVIATRHDLHARLALDALRRGKHVLVEKPLALLRQELDDIVAFYASNSSADLPVLVTGFNRRFSEYARRIVELTEGRSGPMILNYQMNAGYLPRGHWVHTAEGGGRNRGEACHIYDLFTFLTGSRVTDVHAKSIRPRNNHYAASDNFVATMGFDDGSVGTLTYTSLGASEYPKERLQVFVDGQVIVLDDYRELSVVGGSGKGIRTSRPEKGLMEELRALAEAIHIGGDWPIALWEQVQATEIALSVEPYLSGSG